MNEFAAVINAFISLLNFVILLLIRKDLMHHNELARREREFMTQQFVLLIEKMHEQA